MGKGLETPMPVILVGILGGTIAYGLPGLFIGPTVLAVAYDLFIYWSLPARESDRQAQTNPDA
jgi:predicted PurR-regulated permease PerM